jgi:hypothetical protein
MSGWPTKTAQLFSLVKADAAEEVPEARVAAHGIEQGIHLEVLQNV